MKIFVERLQTDGFSPDEIRQIQEYADAAEQAGRFDSHAALVQMNGAMRIVCRTLAEILNQIRPGCWLDEPESPEPQSQECPCCSEHAKRLPDDEKTRAQWSTFEQKLLVLGGRRVVWRGSEKYLPELLSQGRLFEQPVKFLGMPLNRCHENAAIVWGKDVADTQLVTGYGLAHDGLWRQHSWCVRDKRLLETNVLMANYYGIVLSPRQSLESWLGNFLTQRYPVLNEAAARCLRSFPQVEALIRKYEKLDRRRRRKSLRALFHK